MTTKVFQFSALSQNDPGAADGSQLYCKITKITNGSLRNGSFPVNEDVHLVTPPGQNNSGPTPTWFFIPENKMDTVSFNLEIFCPTDNEYPTKSILVTASDVKEWASVPFKERDNQIYQVGEYGVFGFAQEGTNGLIYTITAGVLNPRKQGN